MVIALEFFQNLIALFMVSAPWLLLGLLIAGLMHEWVPVEILQKHMGKNTVGAVSKAAFIGAPLPLCSCGVIPAALGLKRSGASKSSTVSFLVATPETGVDSVSVSYALLGPVFAIVRPISAIFSAIYAGLLVKLFVRDETTHSSEHHSTESSKTTSCCASKKTHSCNSTNEDSAPSNPTVSTRIKNSVSFSAGKLLKDITFWLIIGLCMAALIQTFVPSDFLVKWGDGAVAMLVMALIGVPMYICATASTPLAVGFLAAGLSPGAILVFLLAGPATNIATMGMIRQEMGNKTLFVYLFAVLSSSIGLGVLLNHMFEFFQWQIPNAVAHAHEHDSLQWFYIACSVVLICLMIKNYLPVMRSNTSSNKSTYPKT